MRSDTPEQIRACLSCEKKRCTNCAKDNGIGTPPRGRVRPVVITKNGKRTHYGSLTAAASALGMNPDTLWRALKRGHGRDFECAYAEAGNA